nr:hypothetical protein [Candidatus Sigynarchaeum springense]
MTGASIVKRLVLPTALPVGILAANFINTLVALTVFLRLGADLAQDQDFLYVLIVTLLMPTLLALLVGNARNWTENQLFIGTVAINLPAALQGLVYLFNMPEIDIRWDISTVDAAWDPYGIPTGATMTLLFLALQCLSLVMNVILLRKIVTARTVALDPPASMKGFVRTTPLQPSARSDLFIAGGLLAAIALVAMLFGGANAKYYLLLACAFQLLSIVTFPLFRRGLAPGCDANAAERLKALEPSRVRSKGVPGRVGLLAGYLLVFLLAFTQLIQKNDRASDVEFMVDSIPYLLFGVAIWLVASWLLGSIGFNSHTCRYFTGLGLTALLWGLAFADERRSFTIFAQPAAWLGAGVVIGICIGGIWELLWPLPRWKARRAASNFTIFLLVFVAFANGVVEFYINTTGDDIYLIIFLSVVGLSAILGIISSLLVWRSTRQAPIV